MNDELENKVLETLSLLEPMSFEQIILDFDDDFLQLYPDFDREMLLKILQSLCKQKKVKQIQGEKKADIKWIRQFPKRKGKLDKILDKFKGDKE